MHSADHNSYKLCLIRPEMDLVPTTALYDIHNCISGTSDKGAFIYDVRCFLGIFDLPTYLPSSDTLLHKLIY